MFQDLSNSSLTHLNPNNTKASPSVYSENDGSFNSEENMRWISKKITQKPFIVGKDTSEVNKSFSVGEAPYGAYIGEGLFSIDGYLFKASGEGNVTYDTGLGDRSAFVASTQYAQRFVSDMTHYGKDDELSADYSSFCFSEFDPSNVSFDVENWENAFNNGEPVGFVKMVFRGDTDTSYSSQLTVTTRLGLSYLEYIYNDVAVSSIPLKLMVQDENDLTPDNVRSIVFHDTDPKDYHAVAQVINRTVGNDIYSDTFIMYPVYVKQTDNNKAIITFTDIFTTTYRHAVSEFMTSSYPSTVSNLIDMTGANFNADLTSICKTTTMPSHKYRYYEMYSGTTRQNTTIMRDTFSMSDKVVKKELSNLVFPSTVSSLTIKNDLSYYCLVNPANPIERNGTPVPVALFTSEGSLCTDGFIVSGNDTLPMDQSPIESYIHYIKRNYLLATGQTVTEDAIEAVTLNQLNYWNNFTTFYNTNISPALSAYLNLCYDSLLDNVFFNTNTDEDEDYMNIKILGCGNKYGGGVDDDFAKIATVTATGHKYENGSVSVENFETTVRFEKDITSDKYKVTKHVSRSIKTPLVSGKDLFYYEPVVETFTWNDSGTNVYRFEDPQLFITNCIKSGVEGLESFTLYNGHGSDSVPISNVGEKVALDEFLVPVRKKDDTSVEFNLGGTLSILRTQPIIAVSLVNSACYKFLQNNWLVVFPTTLSVNKDNLSYLRGRDYDNPDKYDGLTLNYKFPCEVTDDELYMFDMGMTSTRSRQAYDVEQSLKYRFIDSEYIRVRREAFIHVNKLYGDNYKGFRECVEEVTENMIAEATGGYGLQDIPDIENALVEHIDYGAKNQISVYGNPDIEYEPNTYFKPNINSNVVFKYERDTSTYPYRDYIKVYLDTSDPNHLTDANADTEFSFKFYCSGGDLCLTGCPSGGSYSTYYAAIRNAPNLADLKTDIGDGDIRHSIHAPKYLYYVVHIEDGTEIPQEGLTFEPMLCLYKAYLLTDRYVAHSDGLGDLSQRMDTLDNLYDGISEAFASVINRPAKNLLCMYNATAPGDILIKFSRPLEKDNYKLYFKRLACTVGDTTNYSLLDENLNVLHYGTFSLGNDKIFTIPKDIVFSDDTKKMAYLKLGRGWNSDYSEPKGIITIEDAMLCREVEWDVTDTYIDGLGDVVGNFNLLCNRATKNKLSSPNFPSQLYNTDGTDTVRIKTEYDLPVDDYVIYITFCGFSGTFCLVDSIGNETANLDVTDNTRDVELYFNKDLLEYYNLIDVRYVKFVYNTMSPIFKHAMLCTKREFEMSKEYVPSISEISSGVFLKELSDLRYVISNIIDSSSKNIYSGSDVSGTSISYIDIDISDITFSTSTKYVLSIADMESTAYNGPYDYYIIDDDTTEHGPYTLKRVSDSSKAYSVFEPTSTDEHATIRIYASDDHEETGNMSCSNIMICYESFYNITENYVKYSPSNAKLYEMIQNL